MKDTIKIKNLNTKMVAHRGVSALEVENTAAAFIAAGNRSYYGVECDIRKTLDGKFVIHHDSSLKRLSGVDVIPEEKTLVELQNIPLIDHDGTATRAHLRLARLEDYISICKKYGKHCVLELKGEYTDEETKSFIDIIDSLGYLDSVTFISFNYENLLKVRKILPNQSAQFLFDNFSEEIIENLIKDKLDVDVRHAALTKEVVDRLHSLGLVINCWTVDDKERAELLAEWGVDQITSNILEGTLA